MIKLDNISYTFPGKVKALESVSAEIGPGIYLFMGANGAGKTTLMHIIAGLRRPKSGLCTIDGANPSSRQPATMQRVFMLDQAMTWPAPTIGELARTHAQFYPSFSPEHLDRNLKEVGLSRDIKLASMSLGYRKRADIAYALALRPEVLLLDEPANGLDIAGREAFQKMLVHCVDENQTVIISTHTVWDVQSMVDGVMIIGGGRLSLNQRIEDLQQRIAFTHTPVHNPEAIYEESGLGGFAAIIPNNGDTETDIDYTLLYKAMHCHDSLPRLLNALNTTRQ